jgi:hypothetical protein
VSAVAPPLKAAVFRTSSTDVQLFAFSSTNTWVPVDTQLAKFSEGKFVVGLALSGSGALLRTSASDIQVFTINPDPTQQVPPRALLYPVLRPLSPVAGQM